MIYLSIFHLNCNPVFLWWLHKASFDRVVDNTCPPIHPTCFFIYVIFNIVFPLTMFFYRWQTNFLLWYKIYFNNFRWQCCDYWMTRIGTDYFNSWSTTSGTSYLKTTENMSPEKKMLLKKKDVKDSDYPQDVEPTICSLALQPWGTRTWTCGHWTWGCNPCLTWCKGWCGQPCPSPPTQAGQPRDRSSPPSEHSSSCNHSDGGSFVKVL